MYNLLLILDFKLSILLCLEYDKLNGYFYIKKLVCSVQNTTEDCYRLKQSTAYMAIMSSSKQQILSVP